MAYEFVWEPDGVVKRFSGTVSADEFLRSVKQVQGDSRFDDVRYVINDFSDASADRICEETLTELSAMQYGAYASNPNCRIAFVTTDPAFGERIKRILLSPDMISYEVQVSPTLTEARDWLDSQPQLHMLSDVMGFRIR